VKGVVKSRTSQGQIKRASKSPVPAARILFLSSNDKEIVMACETIRRRCNGTIDIDCYRALAECERRAAIKAFLCSSDSVARLAAGIAVCTAALLIAVGQVPA
jgi:hypothetical protein